MGTEKLACFCVKYGTGFKRRRFLVRTMPGGGYRQAKLVFGITRQPAGSGDRQKKKNDPLGLGSSVGVPDVANFGPEDRERPHYGDSIRTRLISEIKHHQVWLVHWLETTMELWMLFFFHSSFLRPPHARLSVTAPTYCMQPARDDCSKIGEGSTHDTSRFVPSISEHLPSAGSTVTLLFLLSERKYRPTFQ